MGPRLLCDGQMVGWKEAGGWRGGGWRVEGWRVEGWLQAAAPDICFQLAAVECDTETERRRRGGDPWPRYCAVCSL